MEADAASAASLELLAAIDTTGGSLLHWIFGVSPAASLSRTRAEARVYAVCVGCTYLVMLLFAFFGHEPLTFRPGGPKLPFLEDSNVAFTFLASLPLIVLFTLKDQQTLVDALRDVARDRIVEFDAASLGELVNRWNQYFRRINILTFIAGCVIADVIAALTYVAYSPAHVGYWIAARGTLLPVGWIFVAVVFVFYLCVALYVGRSISIAVFLRALVDQARIRTVPFHPDHCGGLRPVGAIGLRNEYLLSVIGVNVVLLVATSAKILGLEGMLHGMVIAACVGYLVLGPVVFLGPLLSLRKGMKCRKTELLRDVADRLHRELERICGNVKNGQLTKQDEEIIDRLRNLMHTLRKLPVWPFDVNTLKKFLIAYVVPIASGATLLKIREIAEWVWQWIPNA